MSDESLRTAGVLLVVYPTVVFGGASLLWHWITRRTTYHDDPLRRSMWRAGHVHAEVLPLLSLVATPGGVTTRRDDLAHRPPVPTARWRRQRATASRFCSADSTTRPSTRSTSSGGG
jgi:hypothetical protein